MKKLILGLAAVATLGAALPAAAQGFDARSDRQEHRIEQALRHGQLTRREAFRLERQQRQFARAEHRFGRDGRLDRFERARLARLQERHSRQIFRLKHNHRGF
jgi:hypothetical protein